MYASASEMTSEHRVSTVQNQSPNETSVSQLTNSSQLAYQQDSASPVASSPSPTFPNSPSPFNESQSNSIYDDSRYSGISTSGLASRIGELFDEIRTEYTQSLARAVINYEILSPKTKLVVFYIYNF